MVLYGCGAMLLWCVVIDSFDTIDNLFGFVRDLIKLILSSKQFLKI